MGDLLTYLCEPRPWVKQTIAVAHNAKPFNLHFIISRAALLKRKNGARDERPEDNINEDGTYEVHR